MKYKLRAECLQDIKDLIENNPETFRKVTIKKWDDLPDCEMSFKSKESIEDIQEKILKQEDSHTMHETLNTRKDYDGNRSYELSK